MTKYSVVRGERITAVLSFSRRAGLGIRLFGGEWVGFSHKKGLRGLSRSL